jgi:hypothetical protein
MEMAMALRTKVTLGNGEQIVLEEEQIPDLWHICMWFNNSDGIRKGMRKIRDNETWYKARGAEILGTWHLCNDLKQAILHPERIVREEIP